MTMKAPGPNGKRTGRPVGAKSKKVPIPPAARWILDHFVDMVAKAPKVGGGKMLKWAQVPKNRDKFMQRVMFMHLEPGDEESVAVDHVGPVGGVLDTLLVAWDKQKEREDGKGSGTAAGAAVQG